ncbi:protease [Aeromonas bivalvium]|uniref:protease n=1 Tax=Aeromonas bivalvium TaxID=440079 RepID=UPI00370A548D
MMALLLGSALGLGALQCELDVRAQSRVDEPLALAMALSNQGEDTLEVLSWFTPFEGWFADAIDLTLDGQVIPYQGPLAKRGAPGADDRLIIGPRQRIKAEAELTQVYDLSRPGHYRLSYRSMPVQDDQELSPRCPPVRFERLALPASEEPAQ